LADRDIKSGDETGLAAGISPDPRSRIGLAAACSSTPMAMMRIASIATVGVSFWGRGGTSLGLGGGVEDRRAGSLVARGRTAARGAELGDLDSVFASDPSADASPDVAESSSSVGLDASGTLPIGRLDIVPGRRPSANAAVALDIHG
jgi:hypothetical protein